MLDFEDDDSFENDDDPLIRDIRERFEREADPGEWMLLLDEDGSFDLVRRTELAERYIETWRDGHYGLDVRRYRGFRTFTEAKKYGIKWMRDWRDEIKMGIWELERFKKPKVDKPIK